MRITEYLVAIIGKFSNKKQLVLQVELSIDKFKQNVDDFMKSRLSSDIMLYSMVYGQGLRFLVLTQQCVHNCMIFHNSQIYNLYNVYEADRTDIIEKIKHLEL